VKNFIVRLATLADEEEVSALLQASYPILMKQAYDEMMLGPALELMTRAQPTLLNSGTFYVAETPAAALVGCGGWTKERPGDGEITKGTGHIRHFGTHPDWTKQGVGRAIYNRSEIDARKAGVKKFECYSSLNAEGFYTAIGFERIGQIEMPMADDTVLPSVYMTREI